MQHLKGTEDGVCRRWPVSAVLSGLGGHVLLKDGLFYSQRSNQSDPGKQKSDPKMPLLRPPQWLLISLRVKAKVVAVTAELCVTCRIPASFLFASLTTWKLLIPILFMGLLGCNSSPQGWAGVCLAHHRAPEPSSTHSRCTSIISLTAAVPNLFGTRTNFMEDNSSTDQGLGAMVWG